MSERTRAVPGGTRASRAAVEPEGSNLAQVLGIQYLVGAMVIAVALVLPSADRSDRPYLAAVACIGLVVGGALCLGLGRGANTTSNAVTALIGLVAVTVMASRPMGLTPLFYFWPLMLSAYYADALRLRLNAALVIASFAFALATTAQTDDKVLAFVEFTAIVVLVVTAVRRLRARITELFDQLEDVADHDGLTGALNRRAFERRLETLTRAPSAPVSLFMIDIDHFKLINDRHGHPAGDAALRRLGDIVRATCPDALFGRVGGEEFAIAVEGADDHLADTLRLAIKLNTARSPIGFTVSIGVASTDHTSDVWGASDQALYAAKRAGRDRTVTFDPAPARALVANA